MTLAKIYEGLKAIEKELGAVCKMEALNMKPWDALGELEDRMAKLMFELNDHLS